ncbi:ROK family protein [Paenibacillus doosanensis]|uniref:N-acetylglucosamine repressor n=1 Tax=Paenibacillus konkukensis TaxID=2020716 RepID=A0ABY4RQG8_9BACL|nr:MULTISPECIES: ROK family transcriptional regulator [Paenibacillus]MCS7463978.1 ROK family protein [Paenibacillus doosanensis]UQZ83803.1 N-acetylglucosamine repressor [Paenibacillus konkukensis]
MDTIRKVWDQKGSKTAILQMLRVHGPMSRIELTQQTDLSRATISVTINELIELGLVHETELRQSTGGRPATNLELVPYSHIILGADLNHQTWTLGAFDLLGNTIEKRRIPFSPLTPEAAVSALVQELPDFIKQLDKTPIPLLGIGVPGLVDTHNGLLRSSAVMGWQQVELGALLENALGWPTAVLNRSRARGLSECRYGAGKDYRHMIYIGIDSGIGAGIYVNRELIHGALGGAGEIGHTTVDADGPLCPCGNTGCLQMLSAAPAMELEARRLLRLGSPSSLHHHPGFDLQMLKAEDICHAAEQGDELAIQVVNHAATYLGITMANLVNLLNPEAIILGGTIPKESTVYVQSAIKMMRQRAMGQLSAATVVHIGEFKEIGGALGAANMALDRHMSFSYFSPQSIAK